MSYKYLLFLLFTPYVFSQITWDATSIPQSVSRFDDVFFLNENLGWAADGAGASVYKTTDAGANWDLQFELPQNYFRNIEFLNANVGFLGTLNGGFFKTIDGGTTWLPVSLPSNNDAICGMDTVGASTIYGCGAYFGPAYIIKSTNSGTTWTYKDMSAYATGLVEVLFTSELVGYASGRGSSGGVILKTSDGGTTWTTIYTTAHIGDYVWKLQILGSYPNIMFGSVSSISPFDGQLIKSINGGQTWVTKNVPDTDIQAVGFITENHGWMGGHGSGFLETFDSGTTWIDTEIGASLNRIFFVDNTAYTCGDKIYKISTNLSVTSFSDKQNNDVKVTVNPNPVSDKLNVEIDFLVTDNLLLELYSIEGKFIQKLIRDSNKDAIKKIYTFDFPYPKGNYFLNIHTNSNRQTVKIIK